MVQDEAIGHGDDLNHHYSEEANQPGLPVLL